MNVKIPFKLENINLNNIKYTKVKSNSDKTIIYLKYLDKNKFKNLVFQSPSLININEVEVKKNFYNLDIPLVCKSNSKTKEFIDFLNNLDNKIINDAKENSSWFNNFSSKKIKFQKTIRTGNDEYPNMLRMKILSNNNFETIIQVNNKLKIKPTDIMVNSWVKVIMEVYAVWVNKDSFGIYIRPILMSFTPETIDEYNYALLEDSDEIDDVINTVTDNSIFIKNEDEITDNTIQESTVLHMPNNFEEILEDNNSSNEPIEFEEQLSETSDDSSTTT